MKSIKERIFRVVALVLVASFLIMGSTLTVKAAGYPLCVFFEDENYETQIISTSATVGDEVIIRMEWFPEFNNEGYDLTIYNSSGRAVATASKTFTNSSTMARRFAIRWDTTGYSSGRYTVEVVKKFYSLYQWNEAPTTSTLYINLEDPIPTEKPTITSQPKAQTVAVGKTASFTVAAEDAASYQWQYKKPNGSWTNVSENGTDTSYTLTAKAAQNGNQYRCKVTNVVGTVTSKAVKLTVVSKPSITTQPKAQTVAVGKTATFKVVASGIGLKYQWQYKKPDGSWANVSKNGTSATYTVTTKASHDGYQYRCKVSNIAGNVISSAVKLTVVSKPTIKTQPKAASVKAGKAVTFKVVASGTGLKYQWQYKKPGGSWTSITKNGTSATYKLTAKAKENGYQYRCKVTNIAGSVTSKAVKLTVK